MNNTYIAAKLDSLLVYSQFSFQILHSLNISIVIAGLNHPSFVFDNLRY